jgi:flavin reductase (DIM6/NTAB) family NADH-FMN oxidoreductase RutF
MFLSKLKVLLEERTTMEINPEEFSSLEIYKILTSSVLPRPIAWVSTIDKAGCINLAPFSFFTVASINPPVLCFSPLLNNYRCEKDTLSNIRQTGEFVVNIVSHKLVGQMNQSSAPYPVGVNEFEKVGVTEELSTGVKAPGVQESLVRLECTLRQVITFGSEPLAGNLILGNICHIHLHPDIYEDGKVDFEAIDAVGRLAGNHYSTIRDRFEISRPHRVPDN